MICNASRHCWGTVAPFPANTDYHFLLTHSRSEKCFTSLASSSIRPDVFFSQRFKVHPAQPYLLSNLEAKKHPLPHCARQLAGAKKKRYPALIPTLLLCLAHSSPWQQFDCQNHLFLRCAKIKKNGPSTFIENTAASSTDEFTYPPTFGYVRSVGYNISLFRFAIPAAFFVGAKYIIVLWRFSTLSHPELPPL